MSAPGEAELRRALSEYTSGLIDLVKRAMADSIGEDAMRSRREALKEMFVEDIVEHLPALLSELDRLRAAAAPEDSDAYWKEAMR